MAQFAPRKMLEASPTFCWVEERIKRKGQQRKKKAALDIHLFLSSIRVHSTHTKHNNGFSRIRRKSMSIDALVVIILIALELLNCGILTDTKGKYRVQFGQKTIR